MYFNSDSEGIKNSYNHFAIHYNQFVEHYRKADSKISAVADLDANRNVIERKLKNLHSLVGSSVDVLPDLLHIDRYYKEDQRNETVLEHNAILERVGKAIADRDHIYKPDQMLKEESKKISRINIKISRINKSQIPESGPKLPVYNAELIIPALGATTAIESITMTGKEIYQFEQMKYALDLILETIIDEGYAEINQMELWQEMTEEKRQLAMNKFARELDQRKKENNPIRKKIIDTAITIIRETGKGLDEYLTESGKANSKLYMHPKVRRFDNGSSRRWINEAIENGVIQRKLTTE